MPPSSNPAAPRRVAIVGGGISGMACAQGLAPTARVTLLEAEPRLGGHARTVLAGRNGDQAVDTGFIVFNKVNYPNLTRMFDELGVPVVPSDMSFAASVGGGRVEYSLRTLDTMFAQRRNLLSPTFLGMVRDILRFNAQAADAARDTDVPLREFLDRLGVGAAFRDWYIGPIAGAIWSTPARGVMDFPARALVRFFETHALLSHTGQHPWFTVRGGSVEYVRRLEAHLLRAGVEIRKAAPVRGIRRDADGVRLRAAAGEWEAFDEVILATHPDVSLALLSDATAAETAALSRIRYQDNDAVLHSDPRAMPGRRKTWSAWNYVEQASRPDRIGLTYWMNRLQPLPADDPLFLTLNSKDAIREELVHDRHVFRHPVYDLGTMRAVEAIRAGNGTGGTWFCGAWMRDGFHEDGFVSALDVVAAMARRDAPDRAAA